MPIFLERFVLPVLAAAVIAVIVLNPFKLDGQQRVSLFVAVLAVGYFVGHTLHKQKIEPTTPPAATAAAPPTTAPVEQKTGDCGTNTSGNGNNSTVNCQDEKPK